MNFFNIPSQFGLFYIAAREHRKKCQSGVRISHSLDLDVSMCGCMRVILLLLSKAQKHPSAPSFHRHVDRNCTLSSYSYGVSPRKRYVENKVQERLLVYLHC